MIALSLSFDMIEFGLDRIRRLWKVNHSLKTDGKTSKTINAKEIKLNPVAVRPAKVVSMIYRAAA